MKRKFTIAGILMALAFAALVFTKTAKADPPKDGCDGNSGFAHDWQPAGEKAATETEAGYKKWRCRNCAETYEETIPEHKHFFAGGQSGEGWITTTQPSCTRDGEQTRTCIRKDYTETRKIPALGHVRVKISGKAATCTAPGLTDGEKCSRCGEILKKQETIPALGHAAVKVPGKAATCTEAGLTDGEKCSRCGAILKKQETIPALGHVWDEGVVTTQPKGTKPGVRTYTCKNDASHKKTEEFSGITQVLTMLRNGGLGDVTAMGGMSISVQPADTFIAVDGTVKNPLFVEVEGGVAPYTYEWHRTKALSNVNVSQVTNMEGQMLELLDTLQKKGASKRSGFKDAFSKAAKRHGDVSFNPDGMVQGSRKAVEFAYADRVVYTSDQPKYYPDAGNFEYYCVIRDAEGASVTSEKAYVGFALRITEQPRVLNAWAGNAARIKVSDGKKPYRFQWYILNESGEPAELSGMNSDTLPGRREYWDKKVFCVVTDDVGDEVRSNEIFVYCAKPMVITSGRGAAIREGEQGTVRISGEGGYAPLTGQWFDGDGNLLGEADLVISPKGESCSWSAEYIASEFGVYTLVVTDGAGEQIGCGGMVSYRQLRFAEQPRDSVLPYAGENSDKPATAKVSLLMGEGRAPFTYTLIRDDGYETTITEDKLTRVTFEIGVTGLYHVHVEDAEGQWADSFEFSVVDYDLKCSVTEISDIRMDHEIGSSEGTGVLMGEWRLDITGGTPGSDPDNPDYRYKVSRYDPDFQRWVPRIPSTGSYVPYYPGKILYINMPGTYRVQVMDGASAVTECTFDVIYEGEFPLITVQPFSSYSKYLKNADVSVTLHCEAINGEAGNGPYGSGADLDYMWQLRIPSEDPNEVIWMDCGQVQDLFLESVKKCQNDYRCRITNVLTGKYVYTRVSNVHVVFQETGMAKQETVKGRTDIIYFLEGGKEPYYVDKVMKKYNPTGERGDEAECEYNIDPKNIVITINGDGTITVRLKNVDRTTTIAGGKKTPNMYTAYIVDRYGNKVTARCLIDLTR
ncbi:MAG: hypothetical protein II483_03730 [Lachnospiraceae bacterium]|nr:hypothetical protein [Lachnospiraceae bacterium]